MFRVVLSALAISLVLSLLVLAGGTSTTHAQEDAAEPEAPVSEVAEVACAQPEGIVGCWQVDLFDSFDGDTIDTSIWEPGWFVDEGLSGPVNDRENACYDTDQVVVSGGALRISLDETADPACLDKQGEVVELVGGIVSSRDAIRDVDHPARLDDNYYVEARIRVPTVDGEVQNWPAFWTNGFGPWPRTGEIDILEGLGGDLKMNYHYECANGSNCQVGARRHPGDSDDGEWHTYGALRRLATTDSPATITFFFDGEPVETVTDNVVRSPHYIIFTYTSHQWENPIAPGSTMEVDWVRSWNLALPDRGDVTCVDGVDIIDAMAIAQYAAEIRSDASCPLTDPGFELNAAAGDVNRDGLTDIIDALIVAQCSVGAPNPSC